MRIADEVCELRRAMSRRLLCSCRGLSLRAPTDNNSGVSVSVMHNKANLPAASLRCIVQQRETQPVRQLQAWQAVRGKLQKPATMLR